MAFFNESYVFSAELHSYSILSSHFILVNKLNTTKLVSLMFLSKHHSVFLQHQQNSIPNRQYNSKTESLIKTTPIENADDLMPNDYRGMQMILKNAYFLLKCNYQRKNNKIISHSTT